MTFHFKYIEWKTHVTSFKESIDLYLGELHIMRPPMVVMNAEMSQK